MGKRLFWIFVLTMVVITTVAVTYIQSETFAKYAKGKIQAAVARDLGLELSFDRLRIGVLPPSISLLNVDVKVQSRVNPLGLATDTVIKAERLGFSFRMIQAFSRGLQINKIFFNDGEVRLAIPKSKHQGPGEKLSQLVHRPIHLEMSDGFSLSIRQLELRNTALDLYWREEGEGNHLQVGKIGYLAVTPSSAGTNLVLNLEDVDFQNSHLHEHLKALRGSADVSRNLIDLSNLDVQRREAALHAEGRLVGSVDELPKSKPELNVILRSPLAELADFEKSLSSLQGDLTAELKVGGVLGEPSVKGKLELGRLRYSLWDVDKVEAVGSYGPGELTLESFAATSNGGKIELADPLRLALPLKAQAAAVQLRFTGARFEDFAGDLKKTVNNLKFTMNGTLGLKAEFTETGGKAKLGSLAVVPALGIKNFELNNQTFGRKRPYKQIFKVEPFQLGGTINFKNGQLTIPDAKISLATGALAVKGSVAGGNFDLTGTTDAINLGREVGAISGIPMTGEGAVKLHVHGPSSGVQMDFELKQKNASFVRFDFGEVEGVVTYDDGRDLLLLRNVKGRKNSASYTVNGQVDIGTGDGLALDASFGESAPDDLFAIFKEQLKDVSWIPHGMTGTLAGTAKVGGGYDGGLSSLKIDGTVNGRNLSYQGEMVHELDASASLDHGVLRARVLKGRKYETDFTGDIQYRLSGEMKYTLAAPRGKLRNLDFLTATGLPIDGLFSFRSSGEGKWETLNSQTRIEAENAFMRARPMPPVKISFDTAPGQSDFLLTADPGVEVSAHLSHSDKVPSTARFRLNQANFDYLLCALSRRNCTDPSLVFNATADAQFNWKGDNWRHLAGGGRLEAFRLERSGFALGVPAPATFTANDGLLEAQRFRVEGEDTKLGVRLRARVDGSSIDHHVDGQASLRLLEFLNPLIEEARGRLGISLDVNGTLADAKFTGSAQVQDGFLRLSGLDAPVDSLGGKIRFADSRISIDGLNGQLGGGTAQVSGGIELFLNRAPRFDIDLFLANNRLKFFPVNYAEIADAKLSFTGDKAPYLFGGTARVKRVVMRNNFDLGGQKGLQNARYLPEKVAGAKSFYEVRIRAIADGGITVDNNLLDAEFRGEVTLLNNFEFPQILARAELVRGKLLFRNTAFTLDHASIRNLTAEYFNPTFSVGGTANVDNYRISIFAAGTADKPKITLTSSPALAQEDIVSLLAFGYRGEDARRINPNDTNAITYSEVSSILLDQLKLNQNLQSKGIRVKVAPSFETEERIIRRDANTQAAPKVYLQTQILRNLDASFGGTVGASQGGQSLDGKLEYRLGRKASVSAVYEQIPSVDATQPRESYGADLRFRWGFK